MVPFCNSHAAGGALWFPPKGDGRIGRPFAEAIGFGGSMKLAFLAATAVSALALTVAGAQAADLTYEPAPVVEAPAAFNWTGFYAGIHGGYARGHFNSDWDWGWETYKDTVSGGFGGAQIGYNYQFAPNWVAGVEADFALAGVDFDKVDGSWNAEGKVDWFGTLRGRLGYAFDNVLIYGTGGAAYGRVKANEDWMNGPDSYVFSHAKTQWGWTAGAGVEYGVSRNVTLKAEYLYVDLGKSNQALDVDGYSNYDVDVTFHAFKAGLNYKF
jgi:outer membrane immunogenic protein